MKKELSPAVMWSIIGLVVLGVIALGFTVLGGGSGNAEPSQELQQKQAEVQAGLTKQHTGQGAAQSSGPPVSGEAAARGSQGN